MYNTRDLEKKSMQRVSYIDVLRGLLMILVVLGHAIGTVENPINRFILSFHMPAFFILSGMCFKPLSHHDSLLKIIKKKAQGLMWPYFTLSLMGIALYWLLLAGTAKDQDVNVWQSIIGIVWNDGSIGKIVTGGFWFVYDLIWITIIHIVSRKINSYLKLFFLGIIFIVIYTKHIEFYFSEEILRISIGYLFFLLGTIWMQKKEYIGPFLRAKNGGGILFTAGLLITFFFSQENSPVLMFKNSYGNIIQFLATSISGTMMMYFLSKWINSCRLIEFFGKHTLLILQMHFLFLMISHVVLHKFMPSVNNYQFPIYMLHFLIAMLACTIYINVVNKWLKWLVKYPFS